MGHTEVAGAVADNEVCVGIAEFSLAVRIAAVVDTQIATQMH